MTSGRKEVMVIYDGSKRPVFKIWFHNMISSIQMNLVFPSCPSVLIQSGFFDLRPSGNKSPNTCLNYLCCWSHPRKLKTRQSSQINKSTSEPLGTLEHFGAVSSNLPSCCKTFFSRIYIDLATHSTCIDLYWGFLGYTVYPSSSLYAAWAALATSDKEL